jgi:hypothetical protein
VEWTWSGTCVASSREGPVEVPGWYGSRLSLGLLAGRGRELEFAAQATRLSFLPEWVTMRVVSPNSFVVLRRADGNGHIRAMNAQAFVRRHTDCRIASVENAAHRRRDKLVTGSRSKAEQISFETTNDFAANPEPRCPCVLLLDVSGSMGGQPIAELTPWQAA